MSQLTQPLPNDDPSQNAQQGQESTSQQSLAQPVQTDKQPKQAIIVTGSSGLIGQRVVNAASSNFDVIGFDIHEPEAMPDNTTFVHCDMTDDASVAAACERAVALAPNGIASVVHLAAHYDFSGEPSPLYEQLTVEGTRRLLRCLHAHKDRVAVEQFIFSSSLLVMKPAEDLGASIDENSPVDPQWEYPQSKVEAEKVIQEERGEIPAVIIRLAGVFDEDCHSLPISQQIRRIYENDMESHFFPGDVDRGQPFIHLDDLTDSFMKAISARKSLGECETFLVAERGLMSYGELQDAIGRGIYGSDWTTVEVPKFAAKAGAWVKEQMSSEDDPPFIRPWMVDLADQHYPTDVSKAERELGWKPKHSLRQTLPKMIASLRDDPRRWYEINHLELPEELANADRR